MKIKEDDDTVKVHEIDDNFFAAAPSALHLSKGAVPSTVNENRFDHLEKIDTPKDEKGKSILSFITLRNKQFLQL